MYCSIPSPAYIRFGCKHFKSASLEYEPHNTNQGYSKWLSGFVLWQIKDYIAQYSSWMWFNSSIDFCNAWRQTNTTRPNTLIGWFKNDQCSSWCREFGPANRECIGINTSQNSMKIKCYLSHLFDGKLSLVIMFEIIFPCKLWLHVLLYVLV